MARPAIRWIGRRELAKRWRALLVLGLLSGLLGGLVIAGAALARRTITAPDRLYQAVAPGDVHLRVFRDVYDAVAERPEVSRSWGAGISVGRVEGGGSLQYAGVAAVLSPSELIRPVVLSGRPPHAERADEVLVTEEFAKAFGHHVGDHLQMSMLSAAEVAQFDSGFGEPDGPSLDLVITGIGRVPPGVLVGTPVVATPAFSAQHAALFAGYDIALDLVDDSAGAYAVERLVAETTGGGAPTTGAEDFGATIEHPRSATDALIRSSHVLFGGLLAAVAVALVAVLATVAQAWARHHAGGSADQQVEAALGLNSSGRVLARLLPTGAAAGVAMVAATAVAVAASGAGPVGTPRRLEPTGGWRPDTTTIAFGAVATAVAVITIGGVTAWRAGARPRTQLASGRRERQRLAPRHRGWALAGTTFALSSADVRRHRALRLSVVGAVLGVAGIVAGVAFGASRDRLLATPERYGWNADFMVADVTDSLLADLAGDHRLDAVAEMTTASVRVNGRPAAGFEIAARRGTDVGWVIWNGRAPRVANEIAIGPKLADALGLRIGDTARDAAGNVVRVVGTGLEPTANGEALGTSVLFGPQGLANAAVEGRFREALVRIAPGADRAAIVAEYSRYELAIRSLPAEVRNVAELGSLPAVLAGFLAALAAVALAHALAVTTRDRAHDFAVMRALGAPPRHVALAVVTMAMTTLVIGLALGIPLGLGLARLLWAQLAATTGVRGDLLVPTEIVAWLALSAAVVALIAALPAWRAHRSDPGSALRSG